MKSTTISFSSRKWTTLLCLVGALASTTTTTTTDAFEVGSRGPEPARAAAASSSWPPRIPVVEALRPRSQPLQRDTRLSVTTPFLFPFRVATVATTTSTAVAAPLPLALAAAWAMGHIVAGNVFGTRIVIRATQSWYPKITLPSWTPPNRAFAPVWTVLYAMMGVACGRTWHRGSGGLLEAKVWLCWWLGHMLLNVAWAPVFFGLKRLRIALAINYGMVLSLCGILIPRAVDRTTALLLVPYALWLLYATALNQAICQRNPVYFARGSAYNNAMFQADLIALQKAAAQYAAGISKGPK